MLITDIIGTINLGHQFTPPDIYKYWEDVDKQASRHVGRRIGNSDIDIVTTSRPNESDKVKQYRADNERQITWAAVDSFISKVSRIVQDGNVRLSGASQQLNEFIAKNPFVDSGKNYDLETFIYECIFKTSIKQCNDLLIVFPFNPENPFVHPDFAPIDGGLPNGEPVSIAIQIVPFDKIAYVDNDSFVIYGGEREVQHNDKTVSRPFYYACDRRFWYTLEPRIESSGDRMDNIGLIRSQETTVYDPLVWYRHETGESPVNFLAGETQKTKYGFYNESYARPFFEIGDEVINAFSDNQAVRVNFSHPITGVEPTTCIAKGCESGNINFDPKNPCKTCNGTGKVVTPGPYGVYVMPTNNGMLEKNQTRNAPFQYFHPSTDILKHSYDTWKDLLLLAKQTIGLDILEGSGANESSLSRDMKLEDLHDLLQKIARGVFSVTEKMLFQVESILVVKEDARSRPKFNIPKKFKLEDDDALKAKAENALSEERFISRMRYYESEYKGDDEKIRMFEIALCYSPMLMLSDEEIQDRFAKQLYSDDDVIKRDNVLQILYKMSRDGFDLMQDDTKVFAEIDKRLTDRGLLQEKTDFEIAEDDAKSPLLQTVGGVTGIVQISQAVAQGAMTERAAENLLVEVFGFTADTAARLIESPELADVEQTPQG